MVSKGDIILRTTTDRKRYATISLRRVVGFITLPYRTHGTQNEALVVTERSTTVRFAPFRKDGVVLVTEKGTVILFEAHVARHTKTPNG